jgi:hypothetical protein
MNATNRGPSQEQNFNLPHIIWDNIVLSADYKILSAEKMISADNILWSTDIMVLLANNILASANIMVF